MHAGYLNAHFIHMVVIMPPKWNPMQQISPAFAKSQNRQRRKLSKVR